MRNFLKRPQLRAWRVAGLAVLCSTATFLLSGCNNVPPPKPLAQLSAAESDGRRVFAAHCAACHYDRVDEPLHGPALRSLFRKPYLPSGAPANDERVTATITHGRGQMPAQVDLDPQDLDNLLAYLHTL